MPRKKTIPKVSAGVTFEAPLIEYVDQLSMKLDRPRSYVINMILKEHAERNGHGPLAMLHRVRKDA